MAAETKEDQRSMDDLDLEEGECSDSDDGDITSDKISPLYMDKPGSGVNAYTCSRIPQIVIHSDESGEEKSDSGNDNDDDNCPSAGKKHRGNSYNHTSSFSGSETGQTPFVNPLRSIPLESSIMSAESYAGTGKKKRNNVWGSVLTEQILSQDIKQFGVRKNNFSDGYRGVESYDFTIAQEDDRPEMDNETEFATREEVFDEVVDLEKEVNKHENRKRRRNAKERLGRRTYDKNKVRNLTVHEDSEVSEVVRAITDALEEPNIDLFTRIVDAIGKERAIRLFYMTEDVENAGGMMVNNGGRRRTPGGVYIQLLRSEPDIDSEVLAALFGPDEERWLQKKREARKIRKATRRRQLKLKAQMSVRKPEMDLDRPQTPTPTEDLEALDTFENIHDNEGEIVDFPERPATPEPKDDSSDGEEEEDDEGEDIAVVIAKAKAAILMKQRELEENGPSNSKLGETLDIESQNMDVNSLTEASDSHVSSVMSFAEDNDNSEMCDG